MKFWNSFWIFGLLLGLPWLSPSWLKLSYSPCILIESNQPEVQVQAQMIMVMLLSWLPCALEVADFRCFVGSFIGFCCRRELLFPLWWWWWWCFVWDMISCTLGWSWTHYIAKGDLSFWCFCFGISMSPKLWLDMILTDYIASCMLGMHPTNGDTTLGPWFLFLN